MCVSYNHRALLPNTAAVLLFKIGAAVFAEGMGYKYPNTSILPNRYYCPGVRYTLYQIVTDVLKNVLSQALTNLIEQFIITDSSSISFYS